jgi:hypothetical protein
MQIALIHSHFIKQPKILRPQNFAKLEKNPIHRCIAGQHLVITY